MLPEISLGPVTLYTFALMSVLGVWFGGFVMEKRLRELDRPGTWAWEMILVAMIGGLIGASVDWVFQNGGTPGDVIANIFSGGGLVWYGGMIGGMAAFLLWACWRQALGWQIVSVAAFGFLFVQLFGRLGCHLAGDGDYGIPWDGPWAISYADGIVPTPPGVRVHPTPLYEALGLGLLAWILWHFRLRFSSLQSVAIWFIGIFLIRFPMEFIRTNPEVFLSLTTAQLFSLVLGLFGLVLLLVSFFSPGSGSSREEEIPDS